MADYTLSVKIDGDESEFQKALKSCRDAVKDLQKELAHMAGDAQKSAKATDDLAKSADKAADAEKKIGDKSSDVDKLAKSTDKAADKTDDLGDEAKESAKNVDKLADKADDVGDEARDVDKTADATKHVGNEADGASGKMERLGAAAVAVGKLAADAIEKAIDIAVDAGKYILETGNSFEAQMDRVAAISGASAEEVAAFTEQAKELSKTSLYDPTSIGEGFEYMALAGWDAKDMLSGMQPVIDLATASGEELGAVSDILTDGITAFGHTAHDATGLVDEYGNAISYAEHFADVLAQTSASSNTNVAMMGEAFKYVAPQAGAMGYKMEDASLAIGLMANSGIKGSRAGTSLRRILTNLASPTDKVANAMDELGVSLDDGEGHMYSLREVIGQLREGFGDLSISEDELKAETEKLEEAYANGQITEEQYNDEVQRLAERAFGAEGALKAQAAAAIAGQTGMSGLLAIVGASDEDFNKLIESIDSSTGAAANMADTMEDNVQGGLDKAKNAVSVLAIEIHEELQDSLSDFGEWGADAVNRITEGLKNGGVSGAIEAAQEIAGEILDAGVNLLVEKGPEKAGEVTDAIMDLLSNALDAARSRIGELVPAAQDIVVEVAAHLAEKAPEVAASLMGMISDAVDALADYDWGYEMGRVIGYLIKGLKENGPQLAAAAFELAGSFLKYWFTPAAWIQGGIDAIGGIKDGITGKSPEVESEASALFNSVFADMSRVWTDAEATTATTWGAMSADISTNAAAMKNEATAQTEGAAQDMAADWAGVRADTAQQTLATQKESVKTFSSMRAGLAQEAGLIKATTIASMSAVAQYIRGLSGQAYRWGADISRNIASGIRSRAGEVASAARSVAGSVRAYLHFSEPDAGPLADFHTYMPDMMGQLAAGIRAGIPGVTAAVGQVADSIAGLTPAAITTPTAQTYAGAAAQTAGGTRTYNLSVYQQPGESGEGLARRVIEILETETAQEAAVFA